MCRYLADHPLTFPERVQVLLPALLTMQDQAACPFMLPALSQLASPSILAELLRDSEQSSDFGWPASLQRPEVSCQSSVARNELDSIRSCCLC